MKNIRGSVIALAASALLLSACGGGEPAPGGFPGVIVSDTHAYLASNFALYKVTLDNVTEVWRFGAGKNPAQPDVSFAGQPVKLGGTIVVGGGIGSSKIDNHVYGVSDETGIELWRFRGSAESREYVDGVSTDGKLIFAPNGDGNLYALDPSQLESVNEDGVERKSPRLVWKFAATNKLWSRPAVADGRVYQASMDHKLYALDAATGRLVWTFDQSTAPIGVRPAVSGGMLYFGAFDNAFYALDAATGALKWKTTLDAWLWSDPIVDRGVIYTADVRGKVHALKADTGQELWWLETRNAVRAQPVISGDTLYVASLDTLVYAIDLTNVRPAADGRIEYKDVTRKWKDEVNLGRRLTSTPVLSGQNLWVPLFDGDVKLQSLDLGNGARKLAFPIKK